MTDVVFRPLRAGEQSLFLSMAAADALESGVASTGRDFAATLATGHYRPQWTWVAVRDGAVVARAAWWGAPADDTPVALDWFDPGDDLDVAAALLRAAPFAAEYVLIAPVKSGASRDASPRSRSVRRRVEAARRAGRSVFVERLRYEWRHGAARPGRSARLRFAGVAHDDAVVRAVLGRTLTATLDAYSLRDVEQLGLDGAVDEAFAHLTWLPGARDGWQVGYAGDDLVGITVPSTNYAGPVIGYVGVVPEHRGHGYAADLLAQATRWHLDRGATRICADTDTSNEPMAATFDRAGYRVTERRIIMT
jgi:GNAT superfamily N-acetyltransferase